MPPEDAMQKYIDIVTELFPSWASGGADVRFFVLDAYPHQKRKQIFICVI